MTIVAFDFDGTISDSEMTVLLGEKQGVADEMAKSTQRAMNNEIEYAESLRERVSLLSNLDEQDANDAFSQVTLRPGAGDLIQELNENGIHTAILTGGFRRGVMSALEQANVSVDTIVSNSVTKEDGKMTGEVEGPLIEGTKDDVLEKLANEQDVSLAETIAVGDGANDLPMLKIAGLAVGFSPRPAVAPHCDVVVEDMTELRELFVEENLL